MAVLRIRVDFPSAKLPNTEANAARIFVFGATAAGQGVQPFGNLGHHNLNPNSQYAYDLRNPRIAGAISVSSYAPVLFDSQSFASNVTVAGQVAYAVDAGYVIVEDEATHTPLTHAAIMAFV